MCCTLNRFFRHPVPANSVEAMLCSSSDWKALFRSTADLGQWSFQRIEDGCVSGWMPLSSISGLVPSLEASLASQFPQLGIHIPWPTVCRDGISRMVPKLWMFVGKTSSNVLEYRADGKVLMFRKEPQDVAVAALVQYSCNSYVGLRVSNWLR